MGAGSRPTPPRSVLVASVAGDETTHAMIDAVLPQLGPSDALVIADRVGGAFSASLRAHGEKLTVLERPGASVPELRAAALAASHGRVVVVLEDHVIPGPGWLDALTAPFSDPEVVLTWGPVEDASDAAVGRVAFLCDYAPFLPAGSPDVAPPGMNTAYHRGALQAAIDREPELLETFWEGPLHRRLGERGRAVRVDSAVVRHRKPFQPGEALAQRFHQGRHLAARRARGVPIDGRIAWVVASATLPPALLRRTASAARRGGVRRRELLRLAPGLLALHAAGALGEAVGSALGDGGSLERIL